MAKTIALIVSQNNFREKELETIFRILQQYSLRTSVVAKTRNLARGDQGLELEPDLAVGEVKNTDFDGIVFIGGEINDYLNDVVIFKLIHSFKIVNNKLIGAIGEAPLILGNAGVLMDKAVTALPIQEEILLSRGARYTGMPLEVDELIVTAQTGGEKDFAEKIAYLLGG